MNNTGAPFLITRNLSPTYTELLDNYGNAERIVATGPPYEDRALVVVFVGGAGQPITERNMVWRNLNPGKNGNQILRP